jgi:hypothetical protein
MCQVSTQGQAFVYAEKAGFALGSDKGEVTIAMDNTILTLGKLYSIDYSFHVTNSSYRVYNWQFIRLKPLPGQLAIYDSEKRYIGDLSAFTEGSQAGVSDDDWTFLYEGARVGTSLSFRAGIVPNTKYYATGKQLPPGDYYVQLVIYKAYISTNPFRLEGDPILVQGEKTNFYKNFNRAELCRSNALTVRLVN